MKELRRDARARRLGWFSARPLAYDHARRVLWQEAIAAPTLASLLDRDAPVNWESIAQSIAATHANTITLPTERSLAQLLAVMQSTIAVTIAAVPEQAPAIEGLQRQLLARAPSGPSRDALVHGDLHSKNILTDGRRAWLIDFDRVARGDPLADIASLAAELLYRDCIAERALRWSRVSELLASYRAVAAWPIDKNTLGWHVAAALLRERVYRAVTSLKPGRIDAIPRLLQTAAQALEVRSWT
jgi:Ser/Thr protein kinase RdoA (MazF antagonist)